MTADENQIIEFLKASREFFSVREVSKRVGGRRRAEKEPLWARPCLIHLANGGHLQMNEMGHFRYPPEEGQKKKPMQTFHVAPQIAEILARSGKTHLLSAEDIEPE